jgi:hypothetical protein
MTMNDRWIVDIIINIANDVVCIPVVDVLFLDISDSVTPILNETEPVGNLVNLYDTNLKLIVDRHASRVSKEITLCLHLHKHHDTSADERTSWYSVYDVPLFDDLFWRCEAPLCNDNVNDPTVIHGHTLDVIITRDISPILMDVPVVQDPHLCDRKGNSIDDHMALISKFRISRPPKCRIKVNYHKYREINLNDIGKDILRILEGVCLHLHKYHDTSTDE